MLHTAFVSDFYGPGTASHSLSHLFRPCFHEILPWCCTFGPVCHSALECAVPDIFILLWHLDHQRAWLSWLDAPQGKTSSSKQKMPVIHEKAQTVRTITSLINIQMRSLPPLISIPLPKCSCPSHSIDPPPRLSLLHVRHLENRALLPSPTHCPDRKQAFLTNLTYKG